MPYICASGISTSLIWLASSRVGASTRPRGCGRKSSARRSSACPLRTCSTSWRNWLMFSYSSASTSPSRATSGIENARVLPEPVRPRPRMSRPARESGRVSAWIGKAVFLPSAASTRTNGPGTPSSANVWGRSSSSPASSKSAARASSFSITAVSGTMAFHVKHCARCANLLTVAHARYFCLGCDWWPTLPVVAFDEDVGNRQIRVVDEVE